MKMKAIPVLILLFSTTALFGDSMKSIYDFNLKDIDGNSVTLRTYEGKVMLIVNTASKCGFTYQYEGLQTLHESYSEDGLVVLGFPSNDFMGQEPGSEEEIKAFCSSNYDVSFPMFSKTTVKGKKIHPLYEYLTSKETNPEFAGRISWNFNKFLIDRKGNIVGRFSSKVKPEDQSIINSITEALEK